MTKHSTRASLMDMTLHEIYEFIEFLAIAQHGPEPLDPSDMTADEVQMLLAADTAAIYKPDELFDAGFEKMARVSQFLTEVQWNLNKTDEEARDLYLRCLDEGPREHWPDGKVKRHVPDPVDDKRFSENLKKLAEAMTASAA